MSAFLGQSKVKKELRMDLYMKSKCHIHQLGVKTTSEGREKKLFLTLETPAKKVIQLNVNRGLKYLSKLMTSGSHCPSMFA
jgi:hypothetical protein